jgi:TatD DNase family protein
MLIDTHTHLYLEQFNEDRAEVVQRALGKGVERFYLPNVDSATVGPMLEMERQWPAHCFPMMGLHPCSVKDDYLSELATVERWLGQRPFCAIGEIGLDLYWDKRHYAQQVEAFTVQIGWAKQLGLPIVIHTREAMDEALDIVEQEKDGRLWGIFHCFGGSAEQAQRAIGLGFALGIGGVLTFKKSGLDRTLGNVPLASIVLETDAPYLAPTPHRGKRNESAYLPLVAEKLAEVLGTSPEDVAQSTSENALRIFEKKL